jgi:beta-N-acetylhexosaminidase
VGQAIVLSFEGTSVPPYVARALRERRVAGVILFRGNVASPRQLRALTTDLQRAAGGSALVMADQEGGPVRIVSFAAPSVGQAGQSSVGEVSSQAAATGRDLRSYGVNVNLAPVADVPSVAGAALAGRAFTGDAGTVAARVRAAVRAYEAARVGATAKHFPGLGAATVNTDDGPVTIPGSGTAELEPFRAAIGAGVPLVMAAHALYPGLDRDRIASQSAPILGDLLRGRLGFEGAVVTDSMEAAAVLERSSLTTAAERSLLAGADLLLLTGDGSFRPVSRHLLALARRDGETRRRLTEANARVRALRERLGLKPALP